MQLQFGIQGVQLIPVGQSVPLYFFPLRTSASSAVVGWLKENRPQRHAEGTQRPRCNYSLAFKESN